MQEWEAFFQNFSREHKEKSKKIKEGELMERKALRYSCYK